MVAFASTKRISAIIYSHTHYTPSSVTSLFSVFYGKANDLSLMASSRFIAAILFQCDHTHFQLKLRLEAIKKCKISHTDK